MSTLSQAVIWVAAVITGYGIIAAILTIRLILKLRDESYRAKYEEFLSQKRRVQDKFD